MTMNCSLLIQSGRNDARDVVEGNLTDLTLVSSKNSPEFIADHGHLLEAGTDGVRRTVGKAAWRTQRVVCSRP